jgi:hypothetical protein
MMTNTLSELPVLACSLGWVGVLSVTGWCALILISICVLYLFVLLMWRASRRKDEQAKNGVRKMDGLCTLLGWCALLLGILLAWSGLNAAWTDFANMGSASQPGLLLCYRNSTWPIALGVVCCLLAKIQHAVLCWAQTYGERPHVSPTDK